MAKVLAGICTKYRIPGIIGEVSAGIVFVPWIPVLGIWVGMLVDPLSMLFANLIALLGFIVLVYSLDYMT